MIRHLAHIGYIITHSQVHTIQSCVCIIICNGVDHAHGHMDEVIAELHTVESSMGVIQCRANKLS